MGLTIDNCHVCRQRAELMLYAPDNRMVCGECRLVLDAGAVRNLDEPFKSNGKGHESGIRHVAPLTDQEEQVDYERQGYLDVIQRKADSVWVAKLIKEVVAKKILKYDWFRVISNPRWFSVLELRRFALELDPEFEREVPEEDEPERVPREDEDED